MRTTSGLDNGASEPPSPQPGRPATDSERKQGGATPRGHPAQYRRVKVDDDDLGAPAVAARGWSPAFLAGRGEFPRCDRRDLQLAASPEGGRRVQV